MSRAADTLVDGRSGRGRFCSALGVAALLAVMIALPSFLGAFELRVLQQILLFGAIAIAWSMLGALTGYWSFGHTMFFGIGAFFAGLVAPALPEAMPAAAKLLAGVGGAALLTAAIALLIGLPVLRLRGIYFAIAMLGFAEISAEITRNFDVLHGTTGIAMPRLVVAGAAPVKVYYFLFLALLVLTASAFELIRRSRFGLGLSCVGQDENTAAMMGVPTERYKLAVFVISAAFTGAAGVLYGYSLSYITSESVFRSDISLNMVLCTMLGGIGTIWGPIIGVTVLIVVTKVLLGSMLDMHLLFTGLLLIAVVKLAPSGILGIARQYWPALASRAGGRP